MEKLDGCMDGHINHVMTAHTFSHVDSGSVFFFHTIIDRN